MRLRTLVTALLVLFFLLLALAWYDGGREEVRLIERPLELPAGAGTGAGA